MSTSPFAGQQLSFHATLENWAEGMNYCAVPVPAKITEALGTRGPVLVMAQVNESKPFQVSLFPVGNGQHYIRIKAKVRQETKTTTGDRILVRLTVLNRAHVEIPDDLMLALATDGITAAFTLLPPGKQQYIIRRINEAVKPQSRKKRIQEAVEAAHERRGRLIDEDVEG
ncbi:YdeI/OmpD-associated family protein [Gemmatimonas groenlandica]|uniref:DUF1905 domain-containing protein n=1 Tax=Gemmatimonas groenlandica TaxID=2732249 RepID=A0A6M4IXI0_9BACT|nr:YdeI/OmpD-associated family protein [Gemmatimonas groenlandica]QJR37612.1 DUF1905 domain-containing protein [Gemmatimonas groenlandica]